MRHSIDRALLTLTVCFLLITWLPASLGEAGGAIVLVAVIAALVVALAAAHAVRGRDGCATVDHPRHGPEPVCYLVAPAHPNTAGRARPRAPGMGDAACSN